MTAKTLTIASLFLMFAGCAANRTAVQPQPRQFEGPRPQPAVQPQPQPEPAQPQLLMDLPEGWQQGPPPTGPGSEAINGILGNDTLRAIILVAVYPTVESTPQNSVSQVADQLRSNGAVVSEVQTSADGQSASFTWSNAAAGSAGKMIAKVLAGTPASVMLMGMWPAASDAAASADLDTIAASARVGTP